MAVRTELNLRLPNSPGALARVCGLLSAAHVDLQAITLDGGGQLRLVVDNHVRAAGVLRDAHHQVTERDVIMVPHAADGLVPLLQQAAAAGVNIEYAYSSAAAGTASSGHAAGHPPRLASAVIVLGVVDAQRSAAAAGL